MVYYNLEAVPNDILESAVDELPERLADNTGTVQKYATECINSSRFTDSNIEFESLIITEFLQDILAEKLEENRDDLLDDGYSTHDISMIELDIDTELNRSVRLSVSDVEQEVLDYGYDQLPDRFDAGTIADNLEQIFANMQVGVSGSRVEINDFLVTSILRGAMYEKVDDIVYEVKHDERSDYNRIDGEDMRMRVGDAFETMQTT